MHACVPPLYSFSFACFSQTWTLQFRNLGKRSTQALCGMPQLSYDTIKEKILGYRSAPSWGGKCAIQPDFTLYYTDRHPLPSSALVAKEEELQKYLCPLSPENFTSVVKYHLASARAALPAPATGSTRIFCVGPLHQIIPAQRDAMLQVASSISASRERLTALAMAFAMGLHPRLGADSVVRILGEVRDDRGRPTLLRMILAQASSPIHFFCEE